VPFITFECARLAIISAVQKHLVNLLFTANYLLYYFSLFIHKYKPLVSRSNCLVDFSNYLTTVANKSEVSHIHRKYRKKKIKCKHGWQKVTVKKYGSNILSFYKKQITYTVNLKFTVNLTLN